LFESDGFVIDRSIATDGDNLPTQIDGYNALVILGGPASVYDKHQYLRDEEKLIQDAMTKNIPTLGICLGSQLIAKASGARVYKGPMKEIGWCPLELTNDGLNSIFHGLKKDITVFQWHGDTYDLPKNAVTLAKSDLYPVQAFSVGSAVGIQFHLEVSRDMVMEWIDQYRTELESVRDYIDANLIIAALDSQVNAHNHYTKVLYQNFTKIIR
jgi:GMP synthase-like glutamine amidotransferase